MEAEKTNKVKDLVVTLDESSEEQNNTDVLSPEEVKMAEKHGVKVEENVEKNKDLKFEKKEEDKSELPIDDFDSFEKLHDLYQANTETFYKLPKNVRNLYHSQKGLYKRMKDEEEKRKKFEDEIGLNKINSSVARIKLDRIKSRLANPTDLTVEELQEIIDEAKDESDKKDRPLTRKDLEDIENDKQNKANKEAEENKAKAFLVNNRIKVAEDYAKENIEELTGGKYSSFDDVVLIAQEMIKSKDRYAQQLNAVIHSDRSEQEIAEMVVDIAKLSPKWGSSVEKTEKNDEKVDKLVKNASKPMTSANLAGGRGTRDIHISEDMDPEEAAKVWDKIPREIRHKILKKIH